ncbi:MAG: PorT family protein [Ferruginibacter sp.]|nr:PorT family protein [Ferruginibacter sp.]
MITKKLMALSLLTAMVIGAKAQFYVQGGLNLANITKTTDGQTEKNNWLPTFNAGFMGRFGLSDVVDLESGVLLSGRGSKAETYFTDARDNNYVKTKFNPTYIEIPLNAVVKFPLDVKSKSNIFINAGPYIAIGVLGKTRVDRKIIGTTSNFTSDIKFSNDDPFTSEQDDAAYDKLKRFDYGVNLGGGIDFGKFILKANYGLGLAKINSTQSNNTEDDKNKFRTFSISAGIPLGK